MTSDRSIERRVTRLENDRDALYELIDEFRTETRERFTGIETTLTGHDQRLAGIETTLAEVVRRLPEPS